jgi:hypothetical protein
MAAFNSFGSIVPEPSVSNKLNASRISSISSSLKPGLSYVFAARLVPPVLPFVAYPGIVSHHPQQDQEAYHGQIIFFSVYCLLSLGVTILTRASHSNSATR